MSVEHSECRRFEWNIWLSFSQADFGPRSALALFYSFFFWKVWNFLLKICAHSERCRNLMAGICLKVKLLLATSRFHRHRYNRFQNARVGFSRFFVVTSVQKSMLLIYTCVFPGGRIWPSSLNLIQYTSVFVCRPKRVFFYNNAVLGGTVASMASICLRPRPCMRGAKTGVSPPLRSPPCKYMEDDVAMSSHQSRSQI